ncbi:MAG: phosphomannomutase/phosphoglucomutase [Candidatus Delongbacteria bacterium]|nr:phosphomannomutase/phosphoglucomutase [bacterium]MBL7033545.1 phosphomannomutase/phosphoglucomutase [Candidatus Delongbacteria bacterium]
MSIFKAYDIRGIVPTELDAEKSYDIARAAAEYFAARNMVVGTDVRDSRDLLFTAFTEGLRDSGVDTLSIGTVSTPILYYTTAVENYDAGVMITASHNPREYNGFKFCRRGAVPVPSDELQEIKRLTEARQFSSSTRGSLTTHDPLPAYRQHIYKFARFEQSHKIVVDTANAVCGSYLMDLYSDLPLDIVPLYFEVDSQFPNHAPNPLLEENLVDIKQKVVASGAELGAALDGDGDRVIFIDESGETVPGDFTTILLAQALHDLGERDFNVLIDCRSSRVMEEIFSEYGISTTRSRVGHTFIKKTMRSNNSLCGGELSGHYYFRDSYFTENADIALFLILQLMERKGKPLSELVAPLKKYRQSGELNFVVDDVPRVLKEIETRFADADQEWIDGLTINYPDWWCNIRPSNTEPVLRLNLEAADSTLLQEKLGLISQLIQPQGSGSED